MKSFEDAQRQRGAVAILAVGGAVMLIGMVALAIDVGYAVLTRVQLQNAADAGASAGSRELARLYDDLGPKIDYNDYTLTGADKARVLTNINEFTMQNVAARVPIAIGASDVAYGTYDRATGAITPTDTGAEAVFVRARRDDTANGSVSTLLSRILGVDSFDVGANAASAGISPVSAIPSGKVDVPFGIAKAWFVARDSPCAGDSSIRFHPTGTTLGCAGWHTFQQMPANSARVRMIIDGLRMGTYTTPAVVTGSTEFFFIGGSVAAAFPNLIQLYNSKKDAQGNWRVLIPVYDYSNCNNPSGRIRIVGIARARIYGVLGPPFLRVDAEVECDILEFGTGDGPDYGVAVAKTRTIQ